ncbi:MAG: DUF1062 domain-containing protein [Aestuariivirga sp.]
MCSILRVQWTIIPRIAPRPWIACSGCGGLSPFQSSGKIRLNANGKKLDAWLIYKCLACGKTWNRPIFERQNVRDINPAALHALHTNDPGWIRAQAFDVAALRRDAHRIDEFGDVDIHRSALNTKDDAWSALEIALVVPLPTGLRLDRLLAAQLQISRSRLETLHAAGKLRTAPDHRDMLRRRIKHGLRITLDLSGEAAMRYIRKAAIGK